MTVANSIAFPGASVSPLPGGAEVDGTRRIIDFTDVHSLRLSYGGSGVGDCALGLAVSLDGLSSWTLLAKGPNLAATGIVLATTWTNVSFLQPYGDLPMAVIGYTSSLLAGLVFNVKFIDLQMR